MTKEKRLWRGKWVAFNFGVLYATLGTYGAMLKLELVPQPDWLGVGIAACAAVMFFGFAAFAAHMEGAAP